MMRINMRFHENSRAGKKYWQISIKRNLKRSKMKFKSNMKSGIVKVSSACMSLRSKQNAVGGVFACVAGRWKLGTSMFLQGAFDIYLTVGKRKGI